MIVFVESKIGAELLSEAVSKTLNLVISSLSCSLLLSLRVVLIYKTSTCFKYKVSFSITKLFSFFSDLFCASVVVNGVAFNRSLW